MRAFRKTARRQRLQAAVKCVLLQLPLSPLQLTGAAARDSGRALSADGQSAGRRFVRLGRGARLLRILCRLLP